MVKSPSSEFPMNTEQITLGAGCFWCVEAIFESLEGVVSVSSGFSGGTIKNPTYKEVVTGRTGHAEVCQLTFDTTKLTVREILEVFWKAHDPTTLDRQGADVGTQYRSAVFYHTENQREIATFYKVELEKSKYFDSPIVTEISPFEVFYPAENYHQDYFELNGEEMYCKMVIQPKLDKFKKAFSSKLK